MIELGLSEKRSGFVEDNSVVLEESLKRVAGFIVDVVDNDEKVNIRNNSELARFMYATTFAIEQHKKKYQIKAIRKVVQKIEEEFDNNNWIMVSNIYNYMFLLQKEVLDIYLAFCQEENKLKAV